MNKKQAQIIDLFRILGIYVPDTTSKKFINSCLYADTELQFRVNDKLYTIPCNKIYLKVNEAGFLKKVTFIGEDVEYDEIKDKEILDKEMIEFNMLMGGY